jgi:tetratricopeptide (TPR) repeat protein
MGRDDEAIGDFAFAHLLDPSQNDAYAQAAEIAASEARYSTRGSSILSPHFNLDEGYDYVTLTGTVFDRAAFLFEVIFWRGPSFLAHVYQYLLCDVVKVWPLYLLQQAQSVADQPFQRLMLAAWASYDNGQPDRAVELAELAVEVLPSHVKKVVSLLKEADQRRVSGLRPWRDGEMVAASTLIGAGVYPGTEHLIVDPVASFAYFTLGFVGQWSEDSIQAYHVHLMTRPTQSRRAVALNNVATTILSSGDAETAAAVLAESSRLNPRYYMTYRNLARCYAKLGDRERAYATLTEAIDKCTPVCAEAFSERSKYLHVSVEDLDRSTALNPRLSHPYRLRAALLMDQQQGERAVEEMDRVISITMDASDVALRAVFKRDMGMTEGAVEDMALAVSLMPTRDEYIQSLHFHLWELAAAQRQQGDCAPTVTAADMLLQVITKLSRVRLSP